MIHEQDEIKDGGEQKLLPHFLRCNPWPGDSIKCLDSLSTIYGISPFNLYTHTLNAYLLL